MSAEPSSPTAPTVTGPNWDAVTEEILCPLCDYNLRGLIEPRCPECGYKFAWQELIDPAQRLHPYLFEHHPERRAWSFWRTLTAGLRHRRFWKMLHPAQPSYPRRLILFWALSMVPVVFSAAANLGGVAIEISRTNQAARISERAFLVHPRNKKFTDSFIREYGSIDNYLDLHYPVAWPAVFRAVWSYGEVLATLFTPAVLIAVWPWATMAGLLVFQISMRRTRVRRAHVLRCVCYSADISFWLGFAMIPPALILPSIAPVNNLSMLTFTRIFPLEMIGCAGALLVFTGRLILAYRQYLRFPRAIPVILAAQAIGFLIVLNLVVIMLALIKER